MSSSETLKHREAWKYIALEAYLVKANRKHEFEFSLGEYVYDLALFDQKILVEFDEPWHHCPKQQEIDVKKDAYGKTAGFSVIHLNVKPMSVIDPETLIGL